LEEHARIFVEEFRREAARLVRLDSQADEAGQVRRQQLEVELSNLTQNLLGGLVSPILMDMIADREAELARLSARTLGVTARKPADILPHPVLLERFSKKVTALRTSLNDVTVRSEAALCGRR
jgi:hypothetical protein